MSNLTVEETAKGFRVTVGAKQLLIPTKDAVKVWLVIGLLLDNELEGHLNRAMSGGLGAMREAFNEAQDRAAN
jgi:hypothetical protein